jgi:hypothetical protein
LRENPQIVPLLLGTKLNLLSCLVHKVIMNKQFKCTNKTILAYIDERHFFEKYTESSAFKKMSRSEQKHFIEWYVTDPDLSEYYRYALKKYCGVQFKLKGKSTDFYLDDQKKQKLIEEGINGN